MDVEYTEKVKLKIKGLGADLVGVADTEPLKELKTDPTGLLEPFTRAISIAVQLPAAVFNMMTDRPTPLYNAVYQTANRLLDQIAFRISIHLQNDGNLALPVPASQVLDRVEWRGAISHKAVARMAGIGWQGKNLLLITPSCGSRVRLVTVLSNAPLKADSPMKNRCGKCMECRDVCPVDAIKGASTSGRYQGRNEALHFNRCVKKLTDGFAQLPDIGAPICGLCIKACPFSKRKPKQDLKSASDTEIK